MFAHARAQHAQLTRTARSCRPDGTQDPFAGVTSAYEQLYALDGYHPVSLVLNCGDYHFAEYTEGTDILLVDTYSFNVDTTISSEYGTVRSISAPSLALPVRRSGTDIRALAVRRSATRLTVGRSCLAPPKTFGADHCFSVPLQDAAAACVHKSRRAPSLETPS